LDDIQHLKAILLHAVLKQHNIMPLKYLCISKLLKCTDLESIIKGVPTDLISEIQNYAHLQKLKSNLSPVYAKYEKYEKNNLDDNDREDIDDVEF